MFQAFVNFGRFFWKFMLQIFFISVTKVYLCDVLSCIYIHLFFYKQGTFFPQPQLCLGNFVNEPQFMLMLCLGVESFKRTNTFKKTHVLNITCMCILRQLPGSSFCCIQLVITFLFVNMSLHRKLWLFYSLSKNLLG